MKKIIIAVVTLLIGIQGKAQNNKINTANKDYDNLVYSKAIVKYEKLAKKNSDPELFKNLGDSYYFTANLKEASEWYGKFFVNSINETTDKETLYRYIQSLRATSNYAKADQYMDDFARVFPKDIRSGLFKNQPNYRKVIDNNSNRYTIAATNINSKYYDYGPSFYENRLVFASSRGNTKKNGWTDQAYTDIYFAEKNEDGTYLNVQKLDGDVNTSLHEDSPVFTKDGSTMYFTRNNFINKQIGKDSRQVVLLKLYRARLNRGEWTNVEELPFNSDEYSVAHPALSPDEKKLYFASDMPGTKGDSDIYKVDILNNGFGKPVSLTEINTESRETFPFVSSDNELYFSSDGHPGLGGLDIFAVKLDDKKGTVNGEVFNLGAPLNSSADDFGYIVNKTLKTGYFSSNREGGLGFDDIYSFVENKPLELVCKQMAEGVITDLETGKPIEGVEISAFDESGKLIGKTVSSSDGKYGFANISCKSKYKLEAKKELYNDKSNVLTTSDKSGTSNLNFSMQKVPVLIQEKPVSIGDDLAKLLDIKIIRFDLAKSNIRKDAAIELSKVLKFMNENPTVKIDVRSHTDSRASYEYNMGLSDRRAKSTIQWLISKGINPDRLTGKGYGESQLLNECADGVKCSEAKHQLNRRSEFIVISK